MTRNPRRTCKFSFYPGKNFSLSLSLPYSRALPLTRSPHGFVHFSEFFPSSILSDLFAIDRGEEELYFVFFFFFVSSSFEEKFNSQSKSIISDNLGKTCFFISLLFDKQYFPQVFFFFLSSISIRFALLTLMFIFLFFFVPLASNFARIRFKIEQQTSVDGKILTFSSPFSPSRIFTPLSPRKHSFIKRSQTDVKIKI